MTGRIPRVSLAMIVRDEERCLGRALVSAAPLVDEIVVVDTGSSDGTVSVAESHGARVEGFDWVDDFAAARNHALAATDADMVLILDADEWVESKDRTVLRRWARQVDRDTAGLVTVVSESESAGAVLATKARTVRVVPQGCRYVGRIHEQATGFDHLVPVEGLMVRHDGYRSAQLSRKKGRNERLLRQLLDEDPGDPYLRFQLGRERQIAGAFEEAADAYLTVLPLLDHATAWGDDARTRAIYSLHRAGRRQEALALTTDLLRRAPSAEVLFAAGNLFLDLAVEHPARRGAYLPMARTAWEACLAVGEPTDGRDHTPGCGSFLAAENLAAMCEAQGDEQGGCRWRELASSMRPRSTVGGE